MPICLLICLPVHVAVCGAQTASLQLQREPDCSGSLAARGRAQERARLTLPGHAVDPRRALCSLRDPVSPRVRTTKASGGEFEGPS